MKILAINTAGSQTEVVLLDGDGVRFYRDADGRRASAALMPAVDALLNEADLRLEQMDALAVVVGPGSFTGIRIGVSTVRAMAYALRLPVISVNLLEVTAYNRPYDGERVALVDAGNGYCYSAGFDAAGAPISQPVCLTLDEASVMLQTLAPDCVVCSDVVCAARFGGLSVGQGLVEAVRRHAGETADYTQVVPLYIRKPQALCG